MTALAPVGARTQWEVGGPPPEGAEEVRAPAGVVRHDPGDLTVSVRAGTSVAELDAALAEAGQECPLDPRDPAATVGGVLACGLSGHRRLRHGPLRDRVLEVRAVLADGREVKGGGPTVKNVSGYDVPRLFVGSLGTLGVITQVTLRCQPRPAVARWFAATEVGHLYRPAAVLWDGTTTSVLLEGHEADVEVQATGMEPAAAPAWPEGPYRGRISVRPGVLADLCPRLEGVRWLAELGVGTVHVAADAPGPLEEARSLAAAAGGWMLREAGEDLDGFGPGPLPNHALLARIKAALDPEGRLNPGRLPL